MIFLGLLASCSSSDDKDEDLLPPPSISDDKEDQAPTIVGKWICFNDAHGNHMFDPIILLFSEDGTGYIWFTEYMSSDRDEFDYVLNGSKLTLRYVDGDIATIRYELSSNGETLIIYGLDDDDLAVLSFVPLEQ